MKKFWLKIGMLILILTLSAGFTVTVFAYDKEALTYIVKQFVEEWNGTDFQQYLDSGSLGEQDKEKFTNWVNIKGEVGAFDSITDTSFEEKGDEVIVRDTVKYEKGTVIISVTFNKEAANLNPYNAITDASAEKAVESQGGNLADAGKNTLMGVGLVFAVLILISFIISLLKYVPGLFAKKEEKVKEEIIVNTPSVEPEPELTDDTELVAVITAAIMASMACEAPADGLVVRSIRRRR